MKPNHTLITSVYRLITLVVTTLLLSGCPGGGSTNVSTSHTVTAVAGSGGSISPLSVDVKDNHATSLTVTPDSGYVIDSVTGCSGTLDGNTYTTGAITAGCTVSASFVPASYTISASAGSNGTISPSSITVTAGNTSSFTVTPDAGYSISSVSGCGGTLNGNSYTTGVAVSDCTVSAAFTRKTHTVAATAGPDGSISQGSATVNEGDTTSFTVAPNVGFSISSVTGCGGTLNGDTYTTAAVTADCSVSATFILNSYTVTANAGANGTISPGNATVFHGDSVSFTVAPKTGYSIASVTGCGGTLSGNTYTTAAVTADCGVNASFAINSYTVSATAAGNGAISPGSATVNYGSTTNFTVTPTTGYHIDTVTGCGGTLSGNTYTTGAVSADCGVTATFAINSYTVSATAGSNGTISPGSVAVNYGDTTSFTVTPNTGYHIDTVTGCGGTLSGGTYTTGTVNSACSVSASFAVDTFTVSATAGSNGTISPGSTTVNYGDTTVFTVTPSTGYHIDTVTGCGGTLIGNTYTTAAVTSACSVSATFAIDTFAVSATAGSNGAISPGSATVNYGDSASFTVTPNTGYHIDTVTGCGGSLSGNTYTTGAVTSACSVAATFAVDTFTVSATAGSNGTISPGSATVDYGNTAGFTLTPATGYHIDTVAGCGGTLSGNTFTTAAVTSSCSVSATFAIDTFTVSATAGSNGTISPGNATVSYGGTTSFTVTPNTGYHIDTVTGCGGTLSGNTFTTAAVTSSCNVSATFAIDTFTVSATAGSNGAISPGSATVNYGDSASFTGTPNTGYHIDTVTGCGGTLSGNTYTTAAVTSSCSVSATFAIDTFTVSATAGSNGTISPGSATVAYGNTASFTLTPATGYHIDTVTGCGGMLSGNTYTTGAVTSACNVSATFAIDSLTVSATAGSNGAISPGSVTVNYGGTTSFTVTPDTGYHIDTVTGCGGTLSGSTYTTATVTSSCSVSATFAIDTFAVSATAGSNGTVSPGSAIVNYSATTSFTVTPNSGYHIDTVSGCGGSLAGSTYTTGSVTSACSVNATFAVDTFAVSATAGTNGTISPGRATVNYGATTSFTVTPNSGYHIDTVSGCGGSLSGNTYTTGAVTAACSVSATFAADSVAVTAISGTGGTISPGNATVNYGGTASFTVTPNTGYSILDVSGCGGTLSGNTYTTGPVTTACTVNATFAGGSVTVSAIAATGGGSISPGSATVNYGGTTSFTVSPSTGYYIADVSGCGGTLSGNTYTTGAVTAACTVSATFFPTLYTVNVMSDPFGTISPLGAQVGYGQTASFTITPNTGYYLAGASGCGGSLSGSTFTTGAVTADCTINVSFGVNQYHVTATAGANGAISPPDAWVNYGNTTTFTVTPNTGYHVDSVIGCGGSLSGNTYTTGAITADCGVSASFAADTYSVGGTLSGLASGMSVVLQDNGGDDLTLSANGGFTFATAVAGGSNYAVTVSTQPSGQTCSVTNGSGTVGTTAVTNVAVNCVTVLSAPNVVATSGDGSIVLSWAAVPNATSYSVYWGKNPGISSSVYGSYDSSTSGVATTGYTITGLTNGTTYYAVVTAVAGVTEGPDSSKVSATALGVLGSACSTDSMCGSTAPLCTASQCNVVRCPMTPTTEVCGDGIDNDCDGVVDNGCAAPSVPCTRNDTVVIDNADQLYVPCGAVYEKSGTQNYSSSVMVEGWLQVKPQSSGGGTLTLTTTQATISGVIDGSGRGYPNTQGPGGTATGAGGSYGGQGGDAGGTYDTAAAAPYGTATGADIQPAPAAVAAVRWFRCLPIPFR